ncbi:MAG: type I-E CRISPR-associated protein Cse2/CasB [Azospira oryzae]|nr:MAG: type I-E CRISPR-associated protein Cse2/CasB [Azospira oryzae]PZP77467.1 MAG: type I-E CRISPR-associated protein Cse2/CasB [Azospira oryzae]
MTEPAPASPPAPSTLAATVARLAGVIGSPNYSKGDAAALRRWAPGQPVPLAFYRLWLRHASQDLPPDTQIESWMLLVWGLATAGEGGHQPRRPFGQALAESGYSEARLERLLAAPDEVRGELFMSAVRFLTAKGESFDWTEAAAFLLATDTDACERSHRRIAQAFYRHLPQDNTKE